MLKNHFVLASSSPRRMELLEKLGVMFDTYAPSIEEKLNYSVSPEIAIMDLAKQKASVASETFPESLIFAADTVVLINGEYLGKPSSEKDAQQMLEKMNGKSHEVITGCALVEKNKIKTFYSKATVMFDTLEAGDITNYISTGEPFNKAGAYAIQGFGSRLIERIEGDYYAVMGLPVNKLYKALKCYNKGILFTKCNLM